jgi:hypothetical protein
VAAVGIALAQAQVARGQEQAPVAAVGNALAQAEVARGQQQETVPVGPSVVVHS